MTGFKILFILANPDPARNIKPDAEFRDVIQAIKAGRNRDRIEIPNPVLAARWADVVKAVDDERPDVVHFSTHGSTTHLQFVGLDGVQPVAIEVGLLCDLFRSRDSRVKLVLFNACSTAELARQVRDAAGCCAIGTDRPITDPQATNFAASFYGRLSDGESVKEAFDRGRTALGERQGASRGMTVSGLDDEPPTPSIVHLFDVERSAASELVLTSSGHSDLPFHVPFLRNTLFVGRDTDLLRLHDLLTAGGQTPVGIKPTGLTGMGGIGKTHLAVEYTHQFRRHYPEGVFWVNAAPTLEVGLADLGTCLGAEVDAPRDARIIAAFDKLRSRAKINYRTLNAYSGGFHSSTRRDRRRA